MSNLPGGSAFSGTSIFVNGGPLVGNFSTGSDPSSGGRVQSYRVIRCGIKIMPESNITVK